MAMINELRSIGYVHVSAKKFPDEYRQPVRSVSKIENFPFILLIHLINLILIVTLLLLSIFTFHFKKKSRL